MNQLDERSGQKLICREPQGVFKGRINPSIVPIRPREAEHVAGGIKELIASLFVPFALGNVDSDACEQCFAGMVPKWELEHKPVTGLFVGSPDLFFRQHDAFPC
jgi:hypothetical protein